MVNHSHVQNAGTQLADMQRHGGLYVAIHIKLKALLIPHRKGRTKSCVRKRKASPEIQKNNNAAILIEIFNIPTLLMVMSTSHIYYFTMPTRVKLYILLDVVLYRVNAIAFKLGASTNWLSWDIYFKIMLNARNPMKILKDTCSVCC